MKEIENMNSNTADRLKDWLIQELRNWESYHNHKETMAWVVTAFYLPSIIAFGWKLSQPCWITNLFLLMVLGFISYVVFIFVKMQFNRRWEASDVVDSLRRLIIDLSYGTLKPSITVEYEEPTDYWPSFIKARIRKEKTDRKPWHALKDLLCHPNEVDNRWKTELPSYILIVLASLLAALILFRVLILN